MFFLLVKTPKTGKIRAILILYVDFELLLQYLKLFFWKNVIFCEKTVFEVDYISVVIKYKTLSVVF